MKSKNFFPFDGGLFFKLDNLKNFGRRKETSIVHFGDYVFCVRKENKLRQNTVGKASRYRTAFHGFKARCITFMLTPYIGADL